MRILKQLTIIGLIFLSDHSSFASVNSYQWGVNGFDPSLKEYGSRRFTVQQHYGKKDVLDFLVDSKEVQSGIDKINLISKDGSIVSSNECWKAMRHMTAPVACSFLKSNIKELFGKGKIQVLDKTQNIVHEDEIDFNELNKFLDGQNDDRKD